MPLLMKSAFELAMERLEKEDPTVNKPLTDEQRQQLADIDQRYDAKVAEREVFLQGQLAKVRGEEAEQIQQQLRLERERLNEEREAKKDKVRQAG